MKTGYEVIIRGFIKVDPNDPDTVINASNAVKALSNEPGDTLAVERVGEAYANLTDLDVKSKFVNRRTDPIAHAS